MTISLWQFDALRTIIIIIIWIYSSPQLYGAFSHLSTICFSVSTNKKTHKGTSKIQLYMAVKVVNVNV